MYMYYFLAHQLLGQQISDSRKMVRAQNTFLLALDGDVDFQPEALLLLIDRLKLSPQVGAACGRIHPIGSGRGGGGGGGGWGGGVGGGGIEVGSRTPGT